MLIKFSFIVIIKIFKILNFLENQDNKYEIINYHFSSRKIIIKNNLFKK